MAKFMMTSEEADETLKNMQKLTEYYVDFPRWARNCTLLLEFLLRRVALLETKLDRGGTP